jgi:hypothetical protein
LKTPYIGITGFMSSKEITKVLSVLPQNSNRLVMVGVLASNKTIRGETNKFPMRYPKPDALRKIFVKSSKHRRLNLVHFNTSDPDNLFDDLCLVQELAGPHCHGVQLNIAWPDKKVLEQYKKRFPTHTIVLQCGPAAIQRVLNDSRRLALRVASYEYEQVADYVLIDESAGAGKALDPLFALGCLHALTAHVQTSLGVVLAGGFDHRNLRARIASLASNFTFSIDAEGKLRGKNDVLYGGGAKRYLLEADRIFREYMQV